MTLGKCWSQPYCPASGSIGMSAARSPRRLRRRTRTRRGSTPTPTSTLARPCGRSLRSLTARPRQRPRRPAPGWWPPSSAPASTSGCSGTAPMSVAVGPSSRSLVGDGFAAEAVAPALDVPDGGGGEVHRATQSAGVAVALQKTAPRCCRLRRVVIDPHRQFRVPRLEWRVDQITGQHRGITATPDTDGKMVGSMARCRHQAHMIVERMLAADEVCLFCFDDRQYAILDCVDPVLGMLLGPVVVLLAGEQIPRIGEGRDPTAVLQPRVPTDMVGVQMSAHDIVDILDRHPGRCQRAHIVIVVLFVPGLARRPDLVIADAA